MIALVPEVLAGTAALVWLGLLCAHKRFWLIGPRLPLKADAEPDIWPCVVAILSVRGNGDSVGRGFASLLAQDYPGDLRLVVINDSETTPEHRITAEDARRHSRGRITVINAPSGPGGEAGRSRLQALGIAEADHIMPDYYWLIDDGIEFGDQALRALVARAESGGLAIVAPFCRPDCRRLWQKLFVPAWTFYHAMVFPAEAANRPNSRTVLAAPGSALVARDVLDATDGLDVLEAGMASEPGLSSLFKASGYGCWSGYLATSQAGEPAGSRRDFRQGFLAPLAGRFARTRFTTAAAVFFLVVCHLFPPATAASLLWQSTVVGWIGLATVFMMVACYLPALEWCGVKPFWAVTLPVAAAAMAAVLLASRRTSVQLRSAAVPDAGEVAE